MSTIRRARIKASATHLASLAGKRRGADIQKKKDDEISTEVPEKPVETNEKVSSLEDSMPASPAARDCDEKSTITATVEKPRLKARFRPNLSESDQQRGRLRRISGCESSVGSFSPASIGSGTPGRVRTISGGSSEPETTASVPRIPNHDEQFEATMRSPPSPGLALRQFSENSTTGTALSEVLSPPPPPPASLPITPNRTRKLTETSITSMAEKLALTANPTVFDQRKADHKKKFNDGIPERTKLTMFDLIYYNPSDGNRMSTSNSLRSSRAPSVDDRGRENEDAIVPNRLDAVAERLQEEAVDEPDNIKGTSEGQEDEEEEDSNAMPVPQVKVAADGSIILDEASTMIETTATKKAKEDLLKSPLVFESANQATNYGSWGKKKKNADWSDRDTVKFYKALSVFGTDFSLMEGVFKKRSRHELKMKFKKEEKVNRLLVDKCLSQGQTFDPSIFDSDEEDSEDDREQKRKEKENRRKKKQDQDTKVKKRKHRVKGRMYYNDSDDADESELASEPESSSIAENILLHTLNPNAGHNVQTMGPARTLPISRQKRNSNVLIESPQIVQDTSMVVAKKSKPEPESLLKSLLSQGTSTKSSFAIPPALLAANPGLANATPGSLVVVASPASPQVSSPNAQLLEVFMVAEDEQTNDNDEGHSLPKRTRTTSESLDTTSIGRVRTHSGTFN